MWEKNGSRDAFRFFIHEATGGSDHIVFNNASVGVPGIEFFTWPDQWYHADTDTPDKGDPTEMKRVAFIGAATAWSSAHLTDEMLPDLLDAVSDFGYNRVAERGIPRALEVLGDADRSIRRLRRSRPSTIVEAAVERERDAVRSIRRIYTGSSAAEDMVEKALASWQAYGGSLRDFMLDEASRGLPGRVQLTGSRPGGSRLRPDGAEAGRGHPGAGVQPGPVRACPGLFSGASRGLGRDRPHELPDPADSELHRW